MNETPGVWAPWDNDSNIKYPINTSVIGVFNYTIEFNDSEGKFGNSILL